MKPLALATTLALLIGLAVGVVLERDRGHRVSRVSDSVESAAPPAQNPRTAELEAEVARLAERVAALEAHPRGTATSLPSTASPSSPRPPVAAGPELAALRTEMAALIAKRDGEGLIFLMRRLVALGEVGYPSAMEIAKLLLEDAEKDPSEFGDCDLESALGGNGSIGPGGSSQEWTPLLLWSLNHPELSPPAFRALAVSELNEHSELDTAQIFLAALREERDPEIMQALCDGIAYRMRAGIAEDVETALRTLPLHSPASNVLFDALGNTEGAAAIAALKRLSAPESGDELSRRARAQMSLQAPPASGFLVLSLETGSSWHGAGLRTGDLIVEANGKTPENKTETHKIKNPDGTETMGIAITDWLLMIGEDETVSLRVLRDGEVTPLTVRGKDDRCYGVCVTKGEQ